MRLFKSAGPSEKTVREALVNMGVSADRIESLLVADKGIVTLILKASAATLEADERQRYEIEQAIGAMKGVSNVRIVLTAESEGRKPAAPAAPKRVQPDRADLAIPGIAKIIAVASAKGGVGKSTLSLNLAVALAKKGLKIGLLDADIYGPSLPTMSGTTERKPDWKKGEKLKPVEAFGLKLMSIGYLSEAKDAMIWRGPMVMSAINQMLRDVDWGDLDVLVIDTPPGTGDAQLTLAQRVAMDGAIIVSTPQEVALADVRRGIGLFEKTNVPVLGLVENMAWFEDPVSGNRSYIFGEGGARRLAEENNLPLLGEVPLVTAIRSGGDEGAPIAAGEDRAAEIFAAIADGVMQRLELGMTKAAPEIIFE